MAGRSAQTTTHPLWDYQPTAAFGRWLQAQLQQGTFSALKKSYCLSGSIYHLGDAAETIYQVVDGLIGLVKFNAEGQGYMWDACFPGEIFGGAAFCATDPRRQDEARALRPSQVLQIRAREALHGLARDGQSSLLIAWMGARLQQIETVLDVLALQPVEQRVGWVLLRYHEKASVLQPAWNGALDFSHEELARLVGTSREVITRQLQVYRQAGVIETGRRWMRVEPEQLRRLMAERPRARLDRPSRVAAASR